MVAGNWKMHTTVPEALNLTTEIQQRLDLNPLAEVVLLPPFISVWLIDHFGSADRGWGSGLLLGESGSLHRAGFGGDAPRVLPVCPDRAQ